MQIVQIHGPIDAVIKAYAEVRAAHGCGSGRGGVGGGGLGVVLLRVVVVWGDCRPAPDPAPPGRCLPF